MRRYGGEVQALGTPVVSVRDGSDRPHIALHPYSTAVRIAVLGIGLAVTVEYLRNQKSRLNRGLRRPSDHSADRP